MQGRLVVEKPSELNYDYAATFSQNATNWPLGPDGGEEVVIELTPPSALAISDTLGVISFDSFNPVAQKTFRSIFCNVSVDELFFEPFFDENVCYDMPIGGAPPNATRSDCFMHQVGMFQPVPETFATSANGTTVFDGLKVNSWVSPPKTVIGWVNITDDDGYSCHERRNQTYQYEFFTAADVSLANALLYSRVYSLVNTTCLEGVGQCLGVLCGEASCMSASQTESFFHDVVTPAPASTTAPPDDAMLPCESLLEPSPFANGRSWSPFFDPLRKTAELVAPVNDQAFIDEINSEKGLSWRAGASPWFSGRPRYETKAALGTFLPHTNIATTTTKTRGGGGGGVDEAFDARDQWPMCESIGTIRNQGSCGSCWAFAAVEALQDRLCIASKGEIKPTLSPQSVVACDTNDNACGGGWLDNAWRWLNSTGALTEDCSPYEHCDYPPLPNCSAPPAEEEKNFFLRTTTSPPPAVTDDVCPTNCSDGSNITAVTYRASSAFAVADPGDTESMQREIQLNGPIEVGFYVYSDFEQYSAGIYTKSQAAGQILGGHAVKIVGWGVDGGVPYWTVANSWSPAWGEGGFFRILRGANECGIETTPAAGAAMMP